MASTPDRWLEIRVTGLDEEDVPLVAERLIRAGARGAQEEVGALLTHVPPPPDPDAFVAALTAQVREVSKGAAVAWRWQAHRDWETLWRQGLAPRRIGERLVVRPSWTSYTPLEGDLVLVLDPGVAFGTAEHATTRNALRLLEKQVAPGDLIADVGTGTGILAMAAVLLGAGNAVAYDTDPHACEAARENARLNGVEGRIEVVEGPLPTEGPAFDGIVANIEWLRLSPLVAAAAARTRPGGWLALSGILLTQRHDALARCASLDLTPTSEVEDGEWWAVALVRAGA